MNRIAAPVALLCLFIFLTGASAFGQCIYITGDVNMNGDATPFADPIYAINYLRGGAIIPEPESCSCIPYPQCDVNSSCSFNGLDITFIIAYWKGGADMHSCPSCPDPQPDTLLEPRGIDPGLPDSIIVGNLDGTPVPATPGDTILIPVWVKTDESVAGFNISLAVRDSFITAWTGGEIFAPLDTWDDVSFRPVESDRPEAGYTTRSLFGWDQIVGSPSPCLNTGGEYQLIAYFSVATNPDLSLIGRTANIIPSSHSRVGAIAFADSAGLSEWAPIVVNGQIAFDFITTHMGLSRTELVDTVTWGYTTTTDLVISNLGDYHLDFQIEDSVDWISEEPDSGRVAGGQSDTIAITYDGGLLSVGTYYTHVLIVSNDSAYNVTSLPVTLEVQAGVPFGRIEGTVTSPWGHPLPYVAVTLNPLGLLDSTGADGHYAFGPIDAASYTISFTNPSYYDTLADVVLAPYDTLVFDMILRSPPGILQVPGQYTTIQGAVDAAVDADTVLVGPGDYLSTEGFNIQEKHLTVRSSAGPELTPILTAVFNNYDGPPSVLDGFTIIGSEGAGMRVLQASAIIKNNTFAYVFGSGSGAGLNCNTAAVVRLTGNIFTGNMASDVDPNAGGGGFYAWGVDTLIVTGNTFEGNGAYMGGGIYVEHCDDFLIHHNVFRDNYAAAGGTFGGAAAYFNGCSGGQFYNNTIVGNRSYDSPNYSGAVTFNSCFNSTAVFNNIVVQNTAAGLQKIGIYSLDESYNDVWSNSINYLGLGPGVGDISADPLFVGGVPFSYELSAGSPCINAGDPNGPTDPDGSRADMGAFPTISGSGYIAGNVIDSESNPFEGVEVIMSDSSYADTTDSDGAFFFGPLPGGRDYTLQFNPPGCYTDTAITIFVNEIDTVQVSDVQPRSITIGSLSGVVLDTLSNPLSGVSVINQSTQEIVTTNGSGQYMFNSLPDGQSYVLLFYHAYFADTSATTPEVVPCETLTVAPVQMRGVGEGSITGVVLDSLSNPLKGVRVMARNTPYACVSNIGGGFSLSYIPSGQSYDIQFTHIAFMETTITDVYVNPHQTTNIGSVQLTADPGYTGYYVAGDVNCDGDAEPFIDIIYAVNYFRGGPAPPMYYFCNDRYVDAPADANGSCSFNGLDVTYLILYWQGGSDLQHCPDCAEPLPDSLRMPATPDPLIPDTIIIGNLDGTPTYAVLGSTASIPIWVKNDESAAGLNISLAMDDTFLSQWDGGTVMFPLDIWDHTIFGQAEPDRPEIGYTTQSLYGLAHIVGPQNLNLNTGGNYQQIATFSATLNADSALVGQTAQIIPSNNSRVGITAFGDSAGLFEWAPAVIPGEIIITTDSAYISLSRTSFVDTVMQGESISRELYISDFGMADLYYQAGSDSSWIELSLSEGQASLGETDTMVVTFHAEELSTGLYASQINVASNDPGHNTIVIPVVLFVSEPGCPYIVGDANGNGTFNGLDVTYSVAYFKGGPPPPFECECTPGNIWYVAGDVNGSCSFNGLDVTYMVAYFKGGPLPHSCPDCPPAGLLAPPAPGVMPIPAVQPILIPNQNAKTKASSVE